MRFIFIYAFLWTENGKRLQKNFSFGGKSKRTEEEAKYLAESFRFFIYSDAPGKDPNIDYHKMFYEMESRRGRIMIRKKKEVEFAFEFRWSVEGKTRSKYFDFNLNGGKDKAKEAAEAFQREIFPNSTQEEIVET